MPLSPACSTVLCICAKKLQNVQVKLLCTDADYYSDCEATKKKKCHYVPVTQSGWLVVYSKTTLLTTPLHLQENYTKNTFPDGIILLKAQN